MRTLGFRDISLRPISSKEYKVSARINYKVGKYHYWINISTLSTKTLSRIVSTSLASEALLQEWNRFLELSYKEKLEYIKETGSKVYE